MAEVRQGRWTPKIQGDFVVFLIGARLQASHPLTEHPERGMFGFQSLGVTTIGKAAEQVPLSADATARKRLKKLAT